MKAAAAHEEDVLEVAAIAETKAGRPEAYEYLVSKYLKRVISVAWGIVRNPDDAEEIDQARAEEARRRAQERLAEAQSNTERAELQAALEVAIGRLRVTDIVRRRSGRRRIEMPHTEP